MASLFWESDEPKKPRVFTESGPRIALAVVAGMVLGIVAPASAQFFNFGAFQQRPPLQGGGGGFGGGWFGNETFPPVQQRRAPQPRWERRQTVPNVREDFSKAPPAEKRETVAERHILVLGDAMADWLAYGLEGAYAEQPDMGVIRRHRTVSGLIKYQPKGDPADWAAAAKGILATEKADAIVIMLGLDDRVAIRERMADKSEDRSSDQKSDGKDARAKSDGASPRTQNLPSESRMTKRRISNCRRTTLPTAMRRRSQHRGKACALRTASMGPTLQKKDRTDDRRA